MSLESLIEPTDLKTQHDSNDTQLLGFWSVSVSYVIITASKHENRDTRLVAHASMWMDNQ